MPITYTPKFRLPYLLRGSKPSEIATQSQQIAEALEAKIADGSLRGPAGSNGTAGPPGRDGMNAAPADQAVASYVGVKTSATYAALLAMIRAVAPTPPADPMATTTLTGNNQPATAEDDTAVKWTGCRGDAGMWNANQPTRLVATRAGTYFVSANVTFSNAGGGMRGAWFRVNGKDRYRGQSNPPPSATQYAEIDAHNYLDLKAGDYVEVMATVAGAAAGVSIMANTGTLGALEWKRAL